MLTTAKGEEKVSSFLEFSHEFTLDSSEIRTYAIDFAEYHYIQIWESNEHQAHPCPLSYVTFEGPNGEPMGGHSQIDYSAMGPECFMCHNGMFTESEQSDDDLGWGFRMFDGLRRKINGCNDVNVDYVLLPQNANPGTPPNASFEFDLDPNNNAQELTSPDPSGANYTSFELFIDESEEHIADYVSAIPYSGNRSLKINNDHDQFHNNKMEKGFTLHPTDTSFFYSDAIVLQDPSHSENEQPFSKVVLRHGEDVLYETCISADVSNPDLGVFSSSAQSSPIVYRDWICHEVKLGPFLDSGRIEPGDYLTAEFIAADCGLGAHWGYMYVADICRECTEFEITLNQWCAFCPTLPASFCGFYSYEDIDGNTTITDRKFVIVNALGAQVYEGDIITFSESTVDDLIKGEFCFDITNDIFTIIGDGCFDIYVDIYLSNGSKKRSLSMFPNTIGDVANDFYVNSSCYVDGASSHGYSLADCPLGKPGFQCPVSVLQDDSQEASFNTSEKSNSELVNIYPNPASDVISIEVLSPTHEIEIMIVCDQVGNPISTVSGKNINTLNINSLRSGTYKLIIKFKGIKVLPINYL